MSINAELSGNHFMEIVVKCPSCKSRYSFNEEPVSGRLRFPVKCTNCGADGTAEANEYIRKSATGELEQERIHNNVWWRKILRKGEDSDDFTAPGGADHPAAPKPVMTGLGIVGACIGGFAGMMLWYGITAWSGWEIGYVAWAVGILAGLGARLFVPNGNFTMASVAALCALLAIMGGQFLVLKSMFDTTSERLFRTSYSKGLAYAKEAAKVEKDAEIQKLFKKYPMALLTLRDETGEEVKSQDDKVMQLAYTFMTFGGEGKDESMEDLIGELASDPVTAEEIGRFREEEIPFLKELASGKPTGKEFYQIIKTRTEGTVSTREMILQSWSPYQLLWIFLGVGSAYKLAFNKSETEDV